jgi:hypothetical protein
MTANEQALDVLLTYDALYSQAAPGVEDSEMSRFLSMGQWYYIVDKYSAKNNKNIEGFEETEIRTQGLASLIKDGLEAIDPPTVSSNQVGVLPNGVFYELPSDFWLAINEQFKSNIPDCTKFPTNIFKLLPIKPISHDDYNLFDGDPYKMPYVDGGHNGLVWRLAHGKKNNKQIHELITDGEFNITQYRLRYLRYPKDITVDFTTPTNQVNCELSDFTHRAINDITARLLRRSLEEGIPAEQMMLDIKQ